MELESEEGWKLPIEAESKIQLGRGTNFTNFPIHDRTVSRRHVLFQAQSYPKEDIRDAETVIFFEVIGKNPILVCSGREGQKRVFRNSEKGELRVGDRLSISLKRPVFFTLKKRVYGGGEEQGDKAILKAAERRKKRTVERKLKEEKEPSLREEDFLDVNVDEEDEVRELEIGSLDISHINPVKEFGFLPVGQEFKQYPKQRIHDIKDWDWFLEESRANSEDDNEISRGRTRRHGKKKKGNGDDDEDWTGESEDEKLLITKLRSAKRTKHSKTRSKDRQKHNNDTPGGKSMPHQNKSISKYSDDNNGNESLGGFIVDNDEEEEQEDNISDEEEEFEDDEEEFEDDEEDR